MSENVYNELQLVLDDIKQDSDKLSTSFMFINFDYSLKQKLEILKGINNGVDVNKYADIKFDGNQMEQLRICEELGLNVNCILDENIRPGLMNKVIGAMASGLDVEPYLDGRFTEEQLNAIISGLNNNLEASKYAKEEYSPEVMWFCKELLWYSVDIDKYDLSQIPYHTMIYIMAINKKNNEDFEGLLDKYFNNKLVIYS